MALLFGVCFFLYFLKLSAGKGFWKQEYPEKIHDMGVYRDLIVEDVSGVTVPNNILTTLNNVAPTTLLHSVLNNL